MKRSLLLTPLLLLTTILFAQPNLSLQTIATGFDNPVDIAHCGDERLFIVERDGAIRIIEGNGNVLSTPFLDIDSDVSSSPNERGLLGLAFHPDYLNNGYFYVNYTINNGNTRVSRFSVSANDPNVADPNSELVLLETFQPFWNHNGGCMKFGPDGYLYTTIGDGGSGGDPQANGQNRNSYLGKMLRIDVDNGNPYAIPADNPFVNDPSTLDEIWALGLRNAWRFSFDQVTGDVWIGDVGQSKWEEIDFQPASSQGGENYGWRCYEADEDFNTSGCDPIGTMTFPIFVYANSLSVGCSVTGGIVYRGCEFPGLYGHYIFADYCSGRFWSIIPNGFGGWISEEIANYADTQYSAFGENLAGELFVAAHGSGTISKISSSSDFLTKTDESCTGEADGSISFSIPTDQLTSIVWNDGSMEADRSDLSAGTYSVDVSTVNGCVFNSSVELEAGSVPDVPVIELVQDSVLQVYEGGDNYQWYLNGDLIAGANGNSFIPVATGDYTVIVTSNDGCESASISFMFTVSASFEQLGFDKIIIQPNPFESQIQLQLITPQKMEFEVLITDVSGKIVRTESNSVNGVFNASYDLQNLASGTYFVTIKNKNGEWIEQVVKR